MANGGRRWTAGVALVMMSALGFGQNSGEIRITVKDSSGAPVAARGLLTGIADPTIRIPFQTTRLGTYSITNLAHAQYRLHLERDGFAPYTAVVEVPSNVPVDHEAALQIGVSAYSVDVVSSTPLAVLDRDPDELPAAVRTANARSIQASGALALADFLNRRIGSIYLNEIQGNPFQPDLNYRGYTASPLLGTPQGVSVYLDGMRLNQPFGEVVSWDLIPRAAISEAVLIPGSNPLFGLNTLGGSLSLRTKDGLSHPGSTLELSGGSFGRKVAQMEQGGSTASGISWFLTGSLFFEDGWRETSPSSVRQFLAKIGKQKSRTFVGLTLAYANNGLIGNGLQEVTFLNRDFGSVYTKPDLTANRSPFVILNASHAMSSRASISGNAYFRHIRTRTLNGDINEDSLDQSVYQPNAAEQAALRAAGYSGFPVAGENSQNTPFPYWRCIANVLRKDEPGEKCNGLLNRSWSQQRNYGLSGQTSWTAVSGTTRSHFTAGAAYDGNSTSFEQLSELGYLNPDRSITGLAAFADGVTGGDIDGEPLDTRVDLSSRVHNLGVFGTATVSLNRTALTLSGRFNRSSVDNLDRIRPLAGTGSLTGKHVFHRFNPAVGATHRLAGHVNVYGSYAEANRAPSAVELGCADPNTPCKLPNALAGDPPLNQVVTRTFEAGIRSSAESRARWSAGWFRADNRNDILFVASEQTGFGYFKNFGKTLRQGLELELSSAFGRLSLGGSYTLLDATFQSPEEVNGTGNSSNEAAEEGGVGLEGSIEIEPGNNIPLTPRHMFKTFLDFQLTSRFSAGIGLNGVSRSYARGNENNQHEADGTYYLGPGESPGYAVTNLSARYRVASRLEVFAQVNNLFDKHYYSGAQLGATGFTQTGSFIARPFPANNGAFPVRQSTFFAPGAPRGAWAGLRIRF